MTDEDKVRLAKIRAQHEEWCDHIGVRDESSTVFGGFLLRLLDEANSRILRLEGERDALAIHVRPHRPSVDNIRHMHSTMTAKALQPNTTAAEQAAGHRPYTQTGYEQCYLCALISIAEEAEQKYERAMLVVQAARHYRDDATGELSTQNALWDALDVIEANEQEETVKCQR